ncbi:hypothetical protein [Alteromonas sp. a30]|uniref:hypothetical protein n=1 Tax=Alteromonas sp. a30 TaxID=2730917 RepID=UPI00228258B5|nr:hypothetical protein [Alteromonas sp. a30]MCY7297141.1 hypothetical protein [Alteromonas sp. a30]
MPDFETTFRTAMNFLENPHKLWLSDDIKHKRTVLKLVFTDKLEYDLELGFRTAKFLPIAQPFWLTEQLGGGYCDLVRKAGLEPSQPNFNGLKCPNKSVNVL